MLAILGVAAIVGVADVSGVAVRSAQAAEGLPGKWQAPVKDGTQETLDLYPNGAYRSVTEIVDPKAWRSSLERSYGCKGRTPGRAKPKEKCDEKAVDKMAALLTFPEVFIGTYATEAARIVFTHGCAEHVEGCGVVDSKDAGVFFIDGDILTIKLDGTRYKGRVISGDTGTYTRITGK
jgi:hypothetical protein